MQQVSQHSHDERIQPAREVQWPVTQSFTTSW